MQIQNVTDFLHFHKFCDARNPPPPRYTVKSYLQISHIQIVEDPTVDLGDAVLL